MTDTASAIPPPRRSAQATAPPPPPRAERSAPAQSAKSDLPPRVQAVMELVSIPLIPLAGIAAYQTATNPEGHVPPILMDIHTIQTYQQPFAEAVAELADSYPVLGTALDRIATTTPFMALIAVGIAVGAQIAENHGKLPAALKGVSPNLVDREDFARALRDEAVASNGNGTE